jgi:hypothetical protein
MYCDSCGVAFNAGQRFCGSCGKPIVENNTGYAERPRFTCHTGRPIAYGRVGRHVHIVGILTMIGSIMGLLWGSVLMHAGFPHFGRLHLFWMPHPFGAWVLFSALAGLAAGWGLFQRLAWARPLALVVNTLALVYFPFGTLLGLYTLWVLLPRQSEIEYRQIARVA